MNLIKYMLIITVLTSCYNGDDYKNCVIEFARQYCSTRQGVEKVLFFRTIPPLVLCNRGVYRVPGKNNYAPGFICKP